MPEAAGIPMFSRTDLWDWLKAEQRHQPPRRGVRAPVGWRRNTPCTCRHTAKHHKKTGHCRPGCDCTAGANR